MTDGTAENPTPQEAQKPQAPSAEADLRFVTPGEKALSFNSTDWKGFIKQNIPNFPENTLSNASELMSEFSSGAKTVWDIYTSEGIKWVKPKIGITIHELPEDICPRTFVLAVPPYQYIDVNRGFLTKMAVKDSSADYTEVDPTSGEILFDGTVGQRMFFAGVEEAAQSLHAQQTKSHTPNHATGAAYDADPSEYFGLQVQQFVAKQRGLEKPAKVFEQRLQAADASKSTAK